ncbi:hypothetical protein FND36_07030 [Lachnospiraceae bacterium KGMB03038]|nr:hypothetical protein FND36_07030 [Lachnospiraceae bacterium KGMB03038]
MKKRILSLCMILALCLGLLPATALAAAPSGMIIYVGTQIISGDSYWTTDNDGNVTAYSEAGTPTDNYIHYDESSNTLTLHNATIKTSNNDTNVSGAAIGVVNQSGDTELTIQLEGQNTLSETSTGIYVYSSAGVASLTIEGAGRLNVSGISNGVCVVSISSNAALTIQNAEVTATTAYGDGVFVQARETSSASLTVDGGGLTAAAGRSSGVGIRFSFGGDTVTGTPGLTVSNNALVDARDGGIRAGDGSYAQEVTSASGSTGIVFDGKTGTVYGSVELQENLTIDNGESLDIPNGASLTIPSGARLTNEGP